MSTTNAPKVIVPPVSDLRAVPASKYTPLPWEGDEYIEGELWVIRGANEALVAEIPMNGVGTLEMRENTRADVDLIVRAVNSHESLRAALISDVEILADVVQALKAYAPGLVLNSAPGAPEAAVRLDDLRIRIEAQLEATRAALAESES